MFVISAWKVARGWKFWGLWFLGLKEILISGQMLCRPCFDWYNLGSKGGGLQRYGRGMRGRVCKINNQENRQIWKLESKGPICLLPFEGDDTMAVSYQRQRNHHREKRTDRLGFQAKSSKEIFAAFWNWFLGFGFGDLQGSFTGLFLVQMGWMQWLWLGLACGHNVMARVLSNWSLIRDYGSDLIDVDSGFFWQVYICMRTRIWYDSILDIYINGEHNEIEMEIWFQFILSTNQRNYFRQVGLGVVSFDLLEQDTNQLCFQWNLWKAGKSCFGKWDTMDISEDLLLWFRWKNDGVMIRKVLWGSLVFKRTSRECSLPYSVLPHFLSFRIPFYYLQFPPAHPVAKGKSTMSQSYLLENGMVVESPKRLKITLPRFDNSEIIKGYSKTLIGRCMNPSKQDMKSLLFMMPRIWRMEERVVGADLGRGRFQFDFDSEEDIKEVLQMEPFHFDYWMVSLVRWEPSMDRNYPSQIRFWVWVVDLPLQWWVEPTFQMIGDGLGRVEKDGIDLNNGRIRVWVDGFKPLILEVDMSIYTGEKTIVTLNYEKLVGYCRRCNRLCHDAEVCPLNRKLKQGDVGIKVEGRGVMGRSMKSYKGAVQNDRREGNMEVKQEMVRYLSRRGTESSKRGKQGVYSWTGKTSTITEEKERENEQETASEGMTEGVAAIPKGINALKLSTMEDLPDPTRLMLEAFHGKKVDVPLKHMDTIKEGKSETEMLGEGEQKHDDGLTLEGEDMEIPSTESKEMLKRKGDMVEAAPAAEGSQGAVDSVEKLEDEWLDNMSDVEKEFDEKELMVAEDGEIFTRTMTGRGPKPKSARKRLFQSSGIGGTATRMLAKALASPRKGAQGKGRERDAKVKKDKGESTDGAGI